MKFTLADLFEQDEKAKVDLHHPTKYRYHYRRRLVPAAVLAVLDRP